MFQTASDKFESADRVCYGGFARQKLSFKGETISGLALLLFASPLTLLEQTSGVARVILGILLLLSIFSWALILQKFSQLGGLDGKTSKFLQMFRAGRGLSDPNTLRAGVGGTPLISVYAAGYRELESQIGGANPRALAAPIGKLRNASAVSVEMQVAAGEEVRRLEKGMASLATIAGFGFAEAGEQWDDEDGLELIFEIPAGRGPEQPVVQDGRRPP